VDVFASCASAGLIVEREREKNKFVQPDEKRKKTKKVFDQHHKKKKEKNNFKHGAKRIKASLSLFVCLCFTI